MHTALATADETVLVATQQGAMLVGSDAETTSIDVTSSAAMVPKTEPLVRGRRRQHAHAEVGGRCAP